MKSNLPKIFLTAFIGILIFPQVSFAAWWNPFTWKIFSRTPTARVQEAKEINEIEKLRSEVEELKKKNATPVVTSPKLPAVMVDKSKIPAKPVTPASKPVVSAAELKKENPQQYKTLVDENKTKLLEASKLLSNKNIIARVKPSVVYIETAGGSGSGIIISADGYILTNAHVVSDQSTVTVMLSTGSAFDGVVVGRDEKVDLAIVKIVGQDFPMVEFGNSDVVEQGDDVFTLGYPFGLKGDVSFKEGTISRKIFSEDGVYLETSAEIHPGNSGGPLVDTSGKVIGINTASLGQNIKGVSVGETIKFAIPINIARNLIPELKGGRQVVVPKNEAPTSGNPFQSEDSGLKVARCQAEKQLAYDKAVAVVEAAMQKRSDEIYASLNNQLHEQIDKISQWAEKSIQSISSDPMLIPSAVTQGIREIGEEERHLKDNLYRNQQSFYSEQINTLKGVKQNGINEINIASNVEYLKCINN